MSSPLFILKFEENMNTQIAKSMAKRRVIWLINYIVEFMQKINILEKNDNDISKFISNNVIFC